MTWLAGGIFSGVAAVIFGYFQPIKAPYKLARARTHLFVPLPLGGRESHPTDEELPHAVPLVLVTRRCNWVSRVWGASPGHKLCYLPDRRRRSAKDTCLSAGQGTILAQFTEPENDIKMSLAVLFLGLSFCNVIPRSWPSYLGEERKGEAAKWQQMRLLRPSHA